MESSLHAVEPPAGSAALAALRLRTRERHERIEALLALDESIDLPRYREVLRGFHDFLLAWEARVRSVLPQPAREGFDARSRLRLLEQDLNDLQIARRPAAPAARDAVHGLALCTAARAWGSMYVIEGSALGGQVLAPRLRAQLGLHDGRGLAYLQGHGARTGALWRAFRAACELAVGSTRSAIDEACDSANDTFDALGRCFGAEAIGRRSP